MQTIYKYPLGMFNEQELEIKGLVEILSVAVQRDKLVLYSLVDTEDFKKTQIDVVIRGTGHNYELNTGWNFLGTHLTQNGMLVWHIWWNYTNNSN